MAYIEKRQKRGGTATYRVQVRVKGFPAQAQTFKRKADAVKWARQIEAAVDERRLAAVPAEVRDLTVGQLISTYVGEGCPRVTSTRKVAKPDLRNRLRSLHWWDERLGGYALTMLRPSDVARELATLRKGTHGGKPVSNATSNRFLSALSAVFSWVTLPGFCGHLQKARECAKGGVDAQTKTSEIHGRGEGRGSSAGEEQRA